MNMLKAVVVDDEPLARKHLHILLEEFAGRIELVSELRNGSEVVQFIESGNKFDLLISDIRMPVMDGLELLRYVHDVCPDVRSVITSGYADFEYAREAIRLGVSEYILKPINREEFIRTINKLCNESESIAGNGSEKASTGQLLGRAVISEHSDGEMTARLAAELGIRRGFSCLILKFLQDGAGDGTPLSVSAAYSDVFRCAAVAVPGESAKSCVVLVYGEDKEALVRNAGLFARKCIASSAGRRGAVGISNVFEELDGLSRSYREACAAAGMRFVNGRGGVFMSTEREFDSKVFLLCLGRIRSLQSCIWQSGAEARQDCARIFSSVFNKETAQSVSYGQFRSLFLEAIHAMAHCYSRTGRELERFMNSEELSGSVLDDFDTCDEIVEYLCRKLDTLIDEMNILSSQGSLIERIQAHIRSNYQEEVYLSSTAEKFNVSAKYLSRLFKESVGLTFVEYLTAVRIEQAQRLLAITHMPVQEVAFQAGFPDNQYFCRVFKKCTGSTPLEYRHEAWRK